VLWAAFGGRAPGTAVTAPAAVLQAIAASGDASPAEGNFDRVDVEGRVVAAPANRRGDVVFFATLLRSKAQEGWFLSSPGRIVKLAAVGDLVPSGERIAGFGEHPAAAINASGSVAFSAQITGGKSTSSAFLAQQGKLIALVLSGAPTPDTPRGTLADFEPPVLSDTGDVAFLASIRRARETGEAIYLRRRGQLSKLVGSGDRSPSGGIFSAFGNPALYNKGAVAFGAVVDQGPILGGVFLSSGKDVQLVLAAGSPSPTGGIFGRFSEQIELNDAGTIALSAVLRRAGDCGLPRRERHAARRRRDRRGGAWRRDIRRRGRIAALPLYPDLAIAADDALTFAAIVEREGVRRDTLFYFGPPPAKR
jgi:hypothetical protein